jgi:hypothetical protein
MDEPPRPVNRRLPLLGAALIIWGIVGLWVERGAGFAYIPQIGLCLIILLAGLSALRLSRRETSVGTATLFLWSGVLAIFALLLFGFVEMIQQMANLKSYGFFAIIQTLLMILGAPVLWGAALARRADPGSLAAQKTGRLSAGAVQLGFCFLFAAEVHRLAQFRFTEQMGSAASAAVYALFQLVDVGERVLLLWASVESVRAAADDAVILRRAVRIHRIMGGWLILGVAAAVLGNLRYYLTSSSTPGMTVYVWRSALLFLLTFGVAVAVFNRLTVRKPGLDTVANGKATSGVEA